MNFSMSKTIEFDAGHRVPDHESKCRNPHGHRYTVTAHVAASDLVESGSARGMVLDFGDVKRLLMEHVHDVLDHGFIVYNQDWELLELFIDHNVDLKPVFFHDWKIILFPYVPTAENIAKWVFEQLEGPIKESYNETAYLEGVTVFETPSGSATYSRVE